MDGDSRPQLVFFTSARSGPARRMESLVAHLARKERGRLRVIQVDVDGAPAVRISMSLRTSSEALSMSV